MQRSPLAGIRVLDLSRVLAGPWATQTLADLGADVIKVERPGRGDDTRGWGPPWVRDKAGRETRDAAYYLCANRGKRSLTLDISHPEGQTLARRLAERSDVLVENFKVGGLARYGLDYPTLAALNPRLVYCSITGFGADGPYAERPGYDFAIQGMGGLMAITGAPDGAPGGGPMKVGVALADVMTGLYATIAIQAALAERAHSGEGQHIDMALLDVQVATLANQALNYLVSGVAPRRLGNAHPNIVPYQAFATADGHVILAVGNDPQYARFCRLAGHPELIDDPRFATNGARVEHRDELVPVVAGIMRERSAAEWLEDLSAAGVPASPINTLEQVFADPQVRHRGMRFDLMNGAGVAVPQVATPIRYSRSATRSDRAPPALGEHTTEVLTEALGLAPETLAALRREGVI